MKIQEYPTAIEKLMIECAGVTDELASLRDQMRDAEIEALSSILDARNDDGKPLYTNDKARDIAVHQSLKASAQYQEDKAAERKLERRKGEITARAERLRREYQLALINHEAERVGRRQTA